MSGHPSFLELDRLSLGRASAETKAHADTCAQCQAHLGRLEQPTATPQWVKDLGAKPERSRRWRPLVAWLGLVGTAASLVLFAQQLPHEPVVQVKGEPALRLHLKRGAEVSTWDGTAPLLPGDSLRLEVASSGFPHIAVGALEATGQVTLLYRGELAPSGSAMLPLSFTLDDSARDDVLVVVLSRVKVSDDQLVHATPSSSEVWSRRWVLPRAPSPRPTGPTP